MRISRDKYLNDLVARKGNGMVKVVTGARRCGKTYLLFDLFEDHLRAQGVDDDHIIEIALDDLMHERYRDPLALYDYVRSRITNREEPYYVLLDEVQYAISDEEMRGEEPPRLYGVLNGLLRMRNVDVYVTGSNSKMLSTDVMTEFRGRGDEVRVRPLSFAEFMQAYDGDVQHGWAEYVMFGGMPLTLSMRSDEQKSLYLKNLFEETYLKDIVSRNGLRRSQELDDLVDVLASSIGALTNPRTNCPHRRRSRRRSLAARDRRQLPEDRPRTRRGQTRPRRARHPHDERLRFPPRPGQPDDVTPWIGYNVLDSPMRDE